MPREDEDEVEEEDETEVEEHLSSQTWLGLVLLTGQEQTQPLVFFLSKCPLEEGESSLAASFDKALQLLRISQLLLYRTTKKRLGNVH